jgi:hypothetical protein
MWRVWMDFLVLFCVSAATIRHLVAFSCGNWPPKQQRRREQQLDHYNCACMRESNRYNDLLLVICYDSMHLFLCFSVVLM